MVRSESHFFPDSGQFDVIALEPTMREALALAAHGRGLVEPNPLVGAIILDAEGNRVGSGWHQRYGGPHAEIHALAEAGERAHGGTLLVTLEPCCHWGKTPPCTLAVLQAGIRRVVVAMADPFPKVNGGGLQILREAGLEVELGLCQTEAQRLNAAYLKLLKTGRPWVHAKWAMTLDGKIATRTGDSRWISGEESRRRVHELRGCVDAIVVGRGTVVADDPMLTARPPGRRVPTRVIVTASGNLPENCQLRSTAREVAVLVFTDQENVGRLAGWQAAGAEIVGLPSADSGVSVDGVLANLGQRRFTNILVEGGSGLLGSFLDAEAIDEFHIFIAPKIMGGNESLAPVGGKGAERIADALRLGDFKAEASGDDMYLHGYTVDTW